MVKRILNMELPAIAVLRAAVEEIDLDTYFGSTLSLAYWARRAELLGLISICKKPTKKGLSLYENLSLADLPKTRFANWKIKV